LRLPPRERAPASAVHAHACEDGVQRDRNAGDFDATLRRRTPASAPALVAQQQRALRHPPQIDCRAEQLGAPRRAPGSRRRCDAEQRLPPALVLDAPRRDIGDRLTARRSVEVARNGARVAAEDERERHGEGHAPRVDVRRCAAAAAAAGAVRGKEPRDARRQDRGSKGGGVGDEHGDVGGATRRSACARALATRELFHSGLLAKEHALHRLEGLHQLLLRRKGGVAAGRNDARAAACDVERARLLHQIC
jgi:hypothetical protein